MGRNVKGENNPMYGKNHTEETKRKIAESRNEKRDSYDFSYTQSEERNAKISKNQKKAWKKPSQARLDGIERMRQAKLNQPKGTCPHCGKEGKLSAMKQWHFENCKKFKK